MINTDQSLESNLPLAVQLCEKILNNVGKFVIGQQHLRKRLLTSLMTEGHILLEGVPGLAKTLAIKVLANTIGASFQRIQFTPDLLPSDVIGTEIFRPQDAKFEIRKGPIFANLVLADEINRAPAKVQSALLETMQERQVTIGNQTLKIPDPFFVMATQNPIEQEGTYPLPEAQIDRFMVKVKVDYPSQEQEKQMLDLIVNKQSYDDLKVEQVASLEDIINLKKLTEKVYVDEKVRQYIVNIVQASRTPEKYGLKISQLIELGASPRATIALLSVARAEALINGEYYVGPQSIKSVGYDVLRHRIVPSYEAEAQGLKSDDLVKMILDSVEVP